MLILVTCPACGKRVEVDSSNAGLRVRCPRAQCERWFQVGPNGETFMPAELPTLAETAVVDSPTGGDRAEAAVSVIPGPESESPWLPPPIRRSRATATVARRAEPRLLENDAARSASAELPETWETEWVPPAGGRRIRWMLAACIVLAAIGAGAAGGLIWRAWSLQEDALETRAMSEYAEGNFARARRSFQELLERYPLSKNGTQHQFLAELSEVRDLVAGREIDRASRLFREFLKTHRNEPLYKERLPDVWQTAASLAGMAAVTAERLATSEGGKPAEELVQRAHDAYRSAQDLAATIKHDAAVTSKLEELRAQLSRAEQAVARAQAAKILSEDLTSLFQQASPTAAEDAIQLFASAVEQHPPLATDPALKKQLQEFRDHEASWIKYERSDGQERGMPPEVKEAASVWPAPLVQGSPAPAAATDAVAFALARGRLYGLAQSNGEVRWSLFVGMDNHELPARLRPADGGLAELAFIVASETDTLLCVDVQTGRILWQYALRAACPAGPVLAGQRLFLPMSDGVLLEFDCTEGRLLGRYEIGLPLTVPAAYNAATQRLVVPAEHRRIYVFDLGQNRCAGVVYSDHPTDSLRGPPAVNGSQLIVAETDGLQSMKLRAFRLPPTSSDDARWPVELAAEHAIPGWPSFSARSAGDSLGIVTDQGWLGLFGIARGTRDSALFPMSPPLQAGATANARVSRSQIVDVQLNQWWLLHNGKLQRFQFDAYRQRLVPVPGEALSLGEPIHECQTLRSNGRLLLATQTEDGTRTLATAVSRQTARIEWQRQLGIVAATPPIVLGDSLLLADRGGAIIRLDHRKWTAGDGSRTEGDILIAASDGRKWDFVTAADQTLWAWSHHAGKKELAIRKLEGKGVALEKRFRLPSPPASRAVIIGDHFWIAGRDGNVYDFAMNGPIEPAVRFTWRNSRASAEAVAHVLLVSPAELYISDGDRRLQCWRRGDKEEASWQQVPERQIESPAAIVSAALDQVAEKKESHIWVGDTAGTLHRFNPGSPPAKPEEKHRQWKLGGRITSGPSPAVRHVSCVVDRKRLVWLAPPAERPLWTYEAEREEIVGEPQQIGGLILVTQSAGTFVWLDAETGRVLGRERARSATAPAAAAAATPSGKVAAPMSDGTLLLFDVPAKSQ